jgi:SAM-dependent methyltransferase
VDTIYDHPRFYDILFGFDRSREAEFYDATFLRCGARRGDPILELGCGPARVGRLLARRGWRVTGLDRSAAMLAYARAEATAEGSALETICADMTAFAADRSFAAAFNPLSSFRLLHRDADADAHLRCVAAALRPGGVYVLDLGLLANEAEPAVTTDEGWEMSDGDVSVRAENDGITVFEAGAVRRLAWGAEAHLRGYTVGDFAARVAACPAFALESWHPECGRATGVSEWRFAPSTDARAGRVMVVLRRRSTAPAR